MRKSTIAGIALVGMLAITPAAFAGGFGGINLPHGHFNAGGDVSTVETTKSGPGFLTNLYAPADQTQTGHWVIRPYWSGYPFGFAIFRK
jgi:hypothetical protein